MQTKHAVRFSLTGNEMRRVLTTTMILGVLASAAGLVTKAADAPLYQVQDGNKVDEKTFEGWKTWRALACARCHGAKQEGGVGPALVDSLKTMSKADFKTTVMEGRIEKGMPPWKGSQMMLDNWEGLYAYLKGRSDGKIEPGHTYPIGK